MQKYIEEHQENMAVLAEMMPGMAVQLLKPVWETEVLPKGVQHLLVLAETLPIPEIYSMIGTMAVYEFLNRYFESVALYLEETCPINLPDILNKKSYNQLKKRYRNIPQEDPVVEWLTKDGIGIIERLIKNIKINNAEELFDSVLQLNYSCVILPKKDDVVESWGCIITVLEDLEKKMREIGTIKNPKIIKGKHMTPLRKKLLLILKNCGIKEVNYDILVDRSGYSKEVVRLAIPRFLQNGFIENIGGVYFKITDKGILYLREQSM